MMYSIHHPIGSAKHMPEIISAAGNDSSEMTEALASVCGECGSDFLENCPRGCCRVWRRCDWPADHQIIRPCPNGFRRSPHPRLSSFFPLPPPPPPPPPPA